jgi:hypothetical protein
MPRAKKNKVDRQEIVKEEIMQTETNIQATPIVKPIAMAQPEPRQLTKQEIADKQWQKLQEEEMQMVKGRFRNLEMQGAAGYVLASKFKDVEPFSITMEDEEVYEIPLYAARYINQYCSYPNYKEVKDEKGKISIKESVRVQRYRFEPLSGF